MFGRYPQRRPRDRAASGIVRGVQSEQKRRRRLFDSGHVRLAILESIGERARDGFEVIEALKTCGGLYDPGAGIVYPMLSLLEDQGYIAAHEPRGERRRYAITRAGRLHLDENQPFLNAMHARPGPVSADDGEARSAGLREAFARLKSALVRRARAGHRDATRMERMREILTRAAREIEAL